MLLLLLKVWLCTAIAVLLIGPVLWAIQNMSYFYKTTDDNGGGLLMMKNCVWYCYGALLQQGIRQYLKRNLGKYIHIVNWPNNSKTKIQSLIIKVVPCYRWPIVDELSSDFTGYLLLLQ